MRIFKDDKYGAILNAARDEFVKEGYKGASMRSIARGAGVGLSNLYNYFNGKDELYAAVVGPVKDEWFAFITRLLAEENIDSDMLLIFGHCEEVVDDYICMIERYKEELRLLLFHSDGSSMCGFREAFTDHITQANYGYMVSERKYLPELKNISVFFIRVMSAWLVSVIGEVVTHDLDRDAMREFFKEYFRFTFAGWRELTKN